MGINNFFKKSGNNNNGDQSEKLNLPTKSDIKEAIAEINHAKECIALFIQKRAAQQLSVGALHSISVDLDNIVRRLSAYDKA